MTCMMMVRGFEITSITFKHLVNLTELDLSNNLMNSLDPEVFSFLSRLETLDLSGNGLNISKSIFKHLNELKDITIYRNQVSADVEEFIREFYELKFLNNPYLDLNLKEKQLINI